jgi:penicillin-binding protein 2
MSDDGISAATLTRRSLVLGGGMAGTFGVLAGRLYYLQIVKAEDYTALSERNRFNFNILIPSRGRILDRMGKSLAINKQDYRLIIVPEQVKNLDLTLDRISDVVPLSEKTRRRIRKDVKDHASFVPILVADHLDWNSFAALNFKSPELPGVVPQVGEGRAYPFKGTFCHVLGYVGRAGPKDIREDKDPLLRQPTFRIGKTGVEAAAENKLRGKAGRLRVEVSAVGRVVREWPDPKDRATSGQDVWLTLDADLQQTAASLFEEDSGGAAVIDVMTGELRSLISMPTFDGNLFVSGISQAQLDKMHDDEKRPEFNKVISGMYPPASTYKMVVALAGLQDGAIRPRERILCTGKITVGNRDFHCYSRRGHGPMNLKDAIKHSCDVYFYEIGQRLGMGQIRGTALKLGLGQNYDLGIPGQKSGTIPTPDWKRRVIGENWRRGDSLNASIGQGFVLANPLQLAVMTARLANGINAVSPHLVIGDKFPRFEPLGINQRHLIRIQQAMWAVCQEPGGTAFVENGLGLSNVQMAGKSGTGQVRGISLSERAGRVLRNQELPWRLRDHSIFVGYAPFDAPRFAAAAIVEHGGSGSGRAATVVRGLLKTALERDGFAINNSPPDSSPL